MKSSTILKLKAVGMAGILGASAMFAGCPNPSSPKQEPKICECPDPEHLGIGETCDCGGEDCACGLKVYGQLANGVKIYRSGDVSDAEMATAVANAQAGYNGLDDTAHDDIQGKIDEIHIIKDMQFFYKDLEGKLVFAIKADMATQLNYTNLFKEISADIMTPGVEYAMLKQASKDIKLAKAVLTPRKNAVLGKFARTQQVAAVRRGMVLRGNQRLG